MLMGSQGVRQRKLRRLEFRERGNRAEGRFANLPFLLAQDPGEGSVAPALQQTEQDDAVALGGGAIEPTRIGEAKEHSQTFGVPGDRAIEGLRVVDPGALSGADARTGSPFPQLLRARRGRIDLDRG